MCKKFYFAAVENLSVKRKSPSYMQVYNLEKEKCFHVEARFSVVKLLNIILKEIFM